MDNWRDNVRVVVGNVGTVYSGFSILRGIREFKECVELSKEGFGRMSGESVTLIIDDEIEADYNGSLDLASIEEDMP